MGKNRDDEQREAEERRAREKEAQEACERLERERSLDAENALKPTKPWPRPKDSDGE